MISLDKTIDVAVYITRFKLEFDKFDVAFNNVFNELFILYGDNDLYENKENILSCKLSLQEVIDICNKVKEKKNNESVSKLLDIFVKVYDNYKLLFDRTYNYLEDKRYELNLIINESKDKEIKKLSYGVNNLVDILNTRLGVVNYE